MFHEAWHRWLLNRSTVSEFNASRPVRSLTQEGSGVMVKTFDSPADFVLICGEPTGEPIVQHGPFVMNTRQVTENKIE